MRISDSKKLDQIIAMLADMVGVFGKRFDGIDDGFESVDERFGKIERKLDEHSRDLGEIKTLVADNIDKRKQLEVRVTNIEKKIAA
jgi:hypothetical protein